jgi:site-specific recombinase XerC
LDADDVAVFLADLDTHRDRAIVLLMLLGGLRATETRTLRLADVDIGMRQVKVAGKGGRQRSMTTSGSWTHLTSTSLSDRSGVARLAASPNATVSQPRG